MDSQAEQTRLAQYRADPVLYIREQLNLEPTPDQEHICRLLLEPPYRVLVPAAHATGKSFLAAALTSWRYDCWPDESLIITTAPSHRDVVDILWSAIRAQRYAVGKGGFIGPGAPEMRDSPTHYAKGFTAEKGESFQGRHPRYLFFIFDEAIGVDAVYWTTTKTMIQANNPDHLWLAIFNPTDTSSEAYAEMQRGGWHVVQLSALDHPNIQRQLRGETPLHPSAVTLNQFQSWVHDWCEPIEASEANAADLEWPPGSGAYYRVGPEMESRGLGRFPSSATYGVWSSGAWQAATKGGLLISPDALPQIGLDVARFGSDFTAYVVRCGPVALHHERHNGWGGPMIVARLRELCREYAEWWNARRDTRTQAPIGPERIRCKIDADGMGGLGVVDWAHGLNVVEIGAGTAATLPERYPNKRSELWFSTVEKAKKWLLDLARLPQASLRLLQLQAMAPLWKPDVAGRRVVEKKEDTKKRLRRGSPDDMDALNLAFADYEVQAPHVRARPHMRDEPRRRGEGVFGGGAMSNDAPIRIYRLMTCLNQSSPWMLVYLPCPLPSLSIRTITSNSSWIASGSLTRRRMRTSLWPSEFWKLLPGQNWMLWILPRTQSFSCRRYSRAAFSSGVSAVVLLCDPV